MNKYIKNYQTSDLLSEWISEHRLFLLQSVVFLCFLINAFRANTIPDIAILGLAMIIPIFLKSKEISAYIVGFSMGIQLAYVSVACFMVLFLKSNFKIKIVSFVAMLTFAALELTNLLMSPSDEMLEFIRYLAVYALLFFLMFMDYEPQDKIRVVNSYIYGTIIAVLHVFIETFVVFGGDMTKFTDGTFRFGYGAQLNTDLTMAADPNLLGQSCTMVIVFCLTLIMLGYRNKKYYGALFIALLAGTFTISKTFLISLILIVSLMILFVGSWTSYKMIRRRVLLIALVILGIYVILQLYPNYMDNIMSRVDEDDITTGRVDNALIYLDYLMNDLGDLFFGVGMQDVGPKIGFTGSPHSSIIEAVVCWGLFGTVLMLGLIVKSISYHKAELKFRMLNYVPLIVFTVVTQSTQLFRLRDRVFCLLVVILIATIPQNGEKLNVDQEKCSIGD